MKPLALVIILAALGGCSSTRPATVGGECAVFRDPGRVVKGATRLDQRWIDGAIERGIASCGWPRPKA